MQLKNIHISSKFAIGTVGHKYVFIVKADKFFGGEQARDYRSRVYENPSVADLIEAADESVDVTHDKHHIFLESYEIIEDQSPQKDAIGEIKINFGS